MDPVTLTAQHHVKSRCAKTGLFLSNLDHALGDGLIHWIVLCFVALGSSRRLSHPAGPALAHFESVLQMLRRAFFRQVFRNKIS